jgi:hypothetical protein
MRFFLYADVSNVWRVFVQFRISKRRHHATKREMPKDSGCRIFWGQIPDRRHAGRQRGERSESAESAKGGLLLDAFLVVGKARL